MKKTICLTLILLSMLGCLTACACNTNMSGAVTEVDSFPKVEEMMMVLAQNSMSDAKKMMHPQSVENSDAAIAQMSRYLAGREAISIEQISFNVQNSFSTSGNTMEEHATYTVTLTDGEVLYLTMVYLSDNYGEGFTSFQFVLGLVEIS